MEARLRPVNAALSLVLSGGGQIPVLAEAGFTVAGIEVPVLSEGDRVVVDVLLVHRGTGHLVACEAKSGRNVDEAQAQKYGRLDPRQVVRAASVDLGSRAEPTVEPLFVCLAEHSGSIMLGLQRSGVRAGVVAVGRDAITLDNGTQTGELVRSALADPVLLLAGLPRLLPFDHESPTDVLRPAVYASLVARLARRETEVSAAAATAEVARHLVLFGRKAQGRFVRNVSSAVQAIAADEPAKYTWHPPTNARDGYLSIEWTPEGFDPRGRTQGYQSIPGRRTADTRRTPRFLHDPDQPDLLDQLSDLEDSEPSDAPEGDTP